MKIIENPTIKCVTFDLDDTLWAIHPIIARAEKAFHAWLQENLPRITDVYSAEELSIQRHQYFLDYPELHFDLTLLRKKWMRDLSQRFDYPDANLKEGFRIFWKERNTVDLFQDAHTVLAQVSQSFSTGAITNGNADLQEIGIDSYFDFYLTSANVGVSKPHPDIFQTAITSAGVEPQQIVHVGDDPETDVAGAAKMGIRTIWVNTQGSQWSGEIRPDGEIVTIRELPTVLSSLG